VLDVAMAEDIVTVRRVPFSGLYDRRAETPNEWLGDVEE
jgi:hypothetical protein